MDRLQILELQIDKLRSRLAVTPEKVDGKWNAKHFALKGKIRKCMEVKERLRMIKWLAQ